MAGVEKSYRILGLDLVLRADREKYLHEFDQDFSVFASGKAAAGPPDLDFAFREKLGGAIEVTLNGARRDEINAADVPFLYPLVLREIIRNRSDFLFFHGGVAGREGTALIVSGPPGSGKTTLTMKAVRSGFNFFSDEFCPVEIGTGLIHPFPRALRIASGSSRHGKKTLRSAASLRRPVAVRPAGPRCLILLDPVFSPEPRAELVLRVRKERLDEAIKRLPPGPARIERLPGSAYGEIIIPYEGDVEAQGRLVREVIKQRDLILEATLSELPIVDFSNPPQIEKLSPAKAAPIWLSHLFDRSHPLIAEHPEIGLVHTAAVLRNTACFRLIPGELNETGKMLLAAWKEASRR